MNNRLTITSAIATLAASMALIPLISGGKWFFGGLGAIVLTAAVGTATRHRALRALPAVVCLLCALAVLVLYLNLIYASRYSYLRLFPSPHSLGYLWHAAVTGLHDTRRYTAPVPPIPSLEFLASGGIGLVAVLTDLLAVRLRRSALAGLPLLVLFSVPVATNAGKNTTENTILFCIGMAGYLALLSADGRERLRLWGRLVTPWNAAHPSEPDGELGTGPSARALAASGRRIGLAAVVLALFFPLLIPGLHAHKLFHGSGSGPGTGPGNGSGGGVDASVNPLVQMTQGLQQAKPTEVFSYTTTDPDPQYLVEYVLNKLTATEATWVPPPQKSMKVVSAGQLLPPVPGLRSAHVTRVRTTVHMEVAATLDQSYLPLPYAPRVLLNVPRNGLQVDPYNLLVWSPLANLTGVSYTVDSYHVAPTPAQFAAATAKPTGMGSYLTVPTPLRPLISLARQITADDATPYAKAQALQGWLQDPSRFTYDVHARQPSNVHALHNFLYNNRRGYCQQFSFAMTVLARLLGIPARVAVGYDQGTNLGHGRYEVRTSDEHAWTQLYFPGLGWTTWDATPAGNQTGQANAHAPSYTVPAVTDGGRGGGPGQQTPPGSDQAAQNPTHGRVPNEVQGLGINGKLADTIQGSGAAAAPGSTGSSPPVLLLALAAVLLAALVAPRIARSWTRRRRWMTAHGDAGRAHAAWAELLDGMEDLGIEHGPGETPRALATRIAGQQELAGDTRAALDRLARAEELASYARQPGPATTLTADLATVRGALAASVRSAARWRARLLPLSSAGRLRQAAVQALDVLGLLEIATTRLVARITRSRTRQA